MFRLKALCSISFALIFFSTTFSQTPSAPYKILLNTGSFVPPANAQQAAALKPPAAKELVHGKYYRLLQFSTLPDKTLHQQLVREGIELLEYIPHKAYLASLPAGFDLRKLSSLKVRTVLKVAESWKVSAAVAQGNYGDWARAGSKVSLAISYYQNLSFAQVKRHFEQCGYEILAASPYINQMSLQVEESEVMAVVSNPRVVFVDQISGIGVPLSDSGRAIHRANALDADAPMGRHYDGTGVGVIVRDVSDYPPHIDFQGRLSDLTVSTGGTHGMQVAGIAGGAGNLNPEYRGMASGVHLYAMDYSDSFYDLTFDLYLNEGASVTNSAFSSVDCNEGYNLPDRMVDDQVLNYPNLMHVFAGGNEGEDDCAYGAGAGWANLRCAQCDGKNIIAAGNIDGDGNLVFNSSRGPAADGRIKPDLCANGEGQWSPANSNSYLEFGGTSGASPGISGVAAQLYQAYKSLNGGLDPKSALIKSILLNTANDLDNKGPDFKTGWGHINALRAVEVLEDRRYLLDSVDQGGQQTHLIEVPLDTRQVRFMLYWVDQGASLSSLKALVNDLDLVAKMPNKEEVYPWVLDPTPNAANLAAPATRGVDTLNNMEQVLIDMPAAGTYELTVKGTELPFGEKEYIITYELIKNEVQVTYPYGGEAFAPGSTQRIHWDVFEADMPFVLEYSINGGNDWIWIDEVDADTRSYDWAIPDHRTGQAMLRITTDGISDTNDFFFSIGPIPTDLKVDFACPEFLRISWDSIPGADSYDVFLLGDKYMDSVGTSQQAYFDLSVPDVNADNWFAVRARGTDGFVGQRTLAKRYNSGVTDNCFLDHSIATIDILNGGIAYGCGIYEEPVRVQIYNRGLVSKSDIEVYYQFENEAPVMEIFPGPLEFGDTFDFEFSDTLRLSNEGEYPLRAWVSIPNEQIFEDDTLSKALELSLFSGASQSPVLEDFTSEFFPPEDWKLQNSESGLAWDSTIAIQSNGLSGEVAVVRNPDHPFSNQQANLLALPIDLSAMTFPTLSFDLAYALPTSGFVDKFRVEVFSECGNQFEASLFEPQGVDLATTTTKVNDFTPSSAADWQNIELDLSPFIGQTIVVHFIDISRKNNNLYLDNVNVFEKEAGNNTVDLLPGFEFNIYPNPNRGQFNLVVKDLSSRALQLDIMDVLGRSVHTESFSTQLGTNNYPMAIDHLPAGILLARLRGEGWEKTIRMVVQD